MQLNLLLDASGALQKLYNYGNLPATQVFFLAQIGGQIDNALNAFYTARTKALDRHGQKLDNKGTYQFASPGKKEDFLREEAELLAQDVDIAFPPEKISLCAQAVERMDADLPANKRLGFSAKDWLAIQKIIHVIEKEE